jgi:hypothetical protein
VLGGLLVRNPVRVVRAEDCPGGQLAGVTREAAGCGEADVGPAARPLAAEAV